jgi:hypothetical protein
MFCLDDMPRKRFPITIDTRLIEGVKLAAEDAGISINSYMEQLLMGHLKNLGKLPMDARPLPEVRGGKRDGSGRPKTPKSTPTDAAQDDRSEAAPDTTGDDGPGDSQS